MNKKISLGAAIAFMLIVAAAVFSATMIYAQKSFNQKSTDLERSREMYMKFTEVDRTVRENYSGTINETLLMDSVAQGYIKGIGDKYGVYLSAEEIKRSALSKEGEDIGIGAVLEASLDGYLAVKEVYPDSPAQVAGIVAGDLIVKIDDLNITAENVEQALTEIKGEAGTKVTLVVRKGSEESTIPDLTRRVVAIPSVYSRMIGDTRVGYILIKQFNDNTADQFSRELHKVIEAGASSLIFDVRDNKGTSLSAAVRILDKLVPEGVIYSATYRDGVTEVKETSDANEIALPMVVLTNANTASAAELFAQDLKDYNKASTVGVATTGKGILQERLPLSDGSAMDLTIAVINPKSGTTFDSVGVKADYEVPASEGNWSEQDETTDAQLKKALEVAMAIRKAGETVQAAAASSASEASSSEAPSAPPPASSSAPETSEEESESSEESGDESSEASGDDASDVESSGEDLDDEESSQNSRLDSDPSEQASSVSSVSDTGGL